MKHLDGLLPLIDKEFEAIEQNGKFRSREEVDSVYKLIDIAKDVYCIWMYEEDMDGGESYDDGGSYRSYRGDYGSYDDGMSHARGRGRGAKRYADGRYAPTSRDGGSYDGYNRRVYSRDDGKGEYVDNLRKMMMDAPDDNTRQSIQRMIDQMG